MRNLEALCVGLSGPQPHGEEFFDFAAAQDGAWSFGKNLLKDRKSGPKKP